MRWLPVVLAVACVAGCGCPETYPGEFPDEAVLRVMVSDAPDVAPFFRCEGFDVRAGDFCGLGEPLRCTAQDGRILCRDVRLLFSGWWYWLELEPGEGGRARLCRAYTTDVSDDDDCWPGYECAVSGEVVLTSGGGATAHGVFEGGRTIDAAVVLPTAM